jgi:hypothetical protein
VKAWAIEELVKRRIPGYKGKSWWSVPDQDIAGLLGLHFNGSRKAAIKALDQAYLDAGQKKEKYGKATPRPKSDGFLASYEWRVVRMQVLKRDGAKCACCGATPADGRVMNVDHIKNRRDFPSLALDLSNLQVLCDACNHGKANWDSTDWREQFTEAAIGSKLRIIK